MLEQYTDIFQASNTCKDSLSIVLLAHVQEPRGHKNNMQLQCSITERFSVEEFNEIYQGIVAAGYFIHAVYFNELDFIEDYLANPTRFKSCLLYNLARNGKGDNKKTIIPAFCELVGLPHSTSSSLSCALCRNKYYFSVLLQTHNIPTPKSWLLLKDGNWLNDTPPQGRTVICKPCSESASQGITDASIFTVSETSFQPYNNKQCLVQEYISGLECEVPVFCFNGQIKILSPVGIDLKGHPILNEEMSNQYQYEFYSLKEKVPSKTINQIKEYAKRVFALLRMDVYGRIDFRISPQYEPYVFDVSTTPYTIKHSSFAFAFSEMNLPYSKIYETIISAALSK